MEAQTLQVRRTIRIPWMAMLVAALLIVVLAIGVSLAANGSDTTTVPRTVQPIVPEDATRPTAYGYGPSVRGPGQTPGRAATGSGPVTDPIAAANGKPLT